MRFYLGTHMPGWLEWFGSPLFVQHRRLMPRLRPRATLPRAVAPWALDSGGYNELKLHRRWTIPPVDYVAAVRRYRDEVGMLEWASPQDYVCTPDSLERTGLTVAEHLRRTVDNYLELRTLDASLPFVPVVQGWDRDDFHRCVELYDRAGVDLLAEPVVGVGSVAARQDSYDAERILTSLAALGLRLHGFGVKADGIAVYGHDLASADSMAWSYRARKDAQDRARRGLPRVACGSTSHRSSCSNCPTWAARWRDELLAGVDVDRQLGLPF